MLGPKYRFGPYEYEDLEMESLLKVNKEFHRFDPERGKNPDVNVKLYNFMFTIINNMLYNLKRDKYRRFSSPCVKCPLNAYVDGKCTAYEQLEDCKYYIDWVKTNSQKEMLQHVYSVDDGKDDEKQSPLDAMIDEEAVAAVRAKLEPKHQEYLDAILRKEKLNKLKREELECQLQKISLDQCPTTKNNI